MKLLQQANVAINYPVLIFKWFVICSLNAVVSFWMALTSDYSKLYDVISMSLGVMTFVLLYSFLEIHMLKNKQVIRQHIMLFGVLARLPLQFYPIVDLLLGALSISFIKELLGLGKPVDVYLITIMQGLLLSVVCFVLGSLIYGLYLQVQKYK